MATDRGVLLVEYSGTSPANLTPNGTCWHEGRKFTGHSGKGVPSFLPSPDFGTGTVKQYVAQRCYDIMGPAGTINAYPGFQSTNFSGTPTADQDTISKTATSGTLKLYAVSNIDQSVNTETLTYAQQ